MLTFNLEELFKSDVKVLSFDELSNFIKQPAEEYQNFIKPKDREKFMTSGFSTDSTTIVKFLENTLGLELDRIYNNHKRNQFNTIIRQVAQTQKGKKTKLGYYEFRNLILLDDFNKFVLNNFNARKAENEEKAYEEIMFLQQNKFKETQLYRAQKLDDFITTAYALNLVDGLSNYLKERYCLFLYLLENNIFYGNTNLSDSDKEILEIISYRYKQTGLEVYKFDSEFDVNTTNDEQLIKFFLVDADSWANEDINR